ncbi:MAG: hypothetical protein LBP64_04115 [Tannerella sp.]|jgi:hypothetical protein|nr:hypothetical protein [Tannerella sp.]
MFNKTMHDERRALFRNKSGRQYAKKLRALRASAQELEIADYTCFAATRTIYIILLAMFAMTAAVSHVFKLLIIWNQKP